MSKGYNISKEDEERFAKLFNTIDRNKDGRIDISDLSALLKSKNVPNASDQAQHHHKHHIQHWETQLMKHDEDKDGKMSFDEFLKYVTEHEKKLKLYFKKLDTNQDGVIDASEIKESFKNMGVSVSSAEAENLLKRMDRDGTLAIDYGEWRDFLILSPSNNLHDILHYWRHSTIIDIGENAIVPDDFTETEMQTGMWWRHLVSGAAAGAVSRTCTAPLDRLKILFQVHGSKIEKKNKLTISDGFKHMLKEGGVKSLWRGNGINVIKIAPESAIKFMAYEQFKRIFKSDNKEIGPLERFAAGSSAGAFSQTCIYPMEVLKTRLAIRKTGQYKGMIDCAMKLFKNEGPGVFFKGYIPNIIGIIPYAGIDLCIYESLKVIYMGRYKDQDPGVMVLLGCGTTSSTCGQLCSYPLALIRTKLQAEASSKSTMSSMFKKIYTEEGFKGFYRGLAPNFLKVAPAVSISYVVYEHVRKQLGVKMS
ncbi:calcium-binding mitochondrial carrier protein SCaMC-2-like isoform X2 [Mercenaria mercenaria]|uniref:calcium-binding mitochondrial carrier protein SCaMC-2-like isoform X2 n=1 Tax=Mercenaria mercenaria TaxID=6596 RepID=UPI00234E5F64|nr:calcium-binding mitochondrial carrier protein SCaMC-2-like isoform X2 [Mercenaria mercenaria]